MTDHTKYPPIPLPETTEQAETMATERDEWARMAKERDRNGSAREFELTAKLLRIRSDLLEALIAARAELEAYEADATGEHYNNPTINAAIAKAIGE